MVEVKRKDAPAKISPSKRVKTENASVPSLNAPLPSVPLSPPLEALGETERGNVEAIGDRPERETANPEAKESSKESPGRESREVPEEKESNDGVEEERAKEESKEKSKEEAKEESEEGKGESNESSKKDHSKEAKQSSDSRKESESKEEKETGNPPLYPASDIKQRGHDFLSQLRTQLVTALSFPLSI